MISDASEAAIDQIVASCNGDIRGALKALLRSTSSSRRNWRSSTRR